MQSCNHEHCKYFCVECNISCCSDCAIEKCRFHNIIKIVVLEQLLESLSTFTFLDKFKNVQHKLIEYKQTLDLYLQFIESLNNEIAEVQNSINLE
jgi:hypothetical protein